jgi:hypothetical protein
MGNKRTEKLASLILIVLFGVLLDTGPARASGGELILEIINSCDIELAGDDCTADLKLTNNTDEVLNGEAFLHIDYEGICGDGYFDGEGIEAELSIRGGNWIPFSGWDSGTTVASGFYIYKNENNLKLKIETVPNLCPGKYTFNMTVEGGKYSSPQTTIGGSLSDQSDKSIDINNDGKVDMFEFVSIMADWNKTGTNIATDFNSDGKVDILDFAILMANWTG